VGLADIKPFLEDVDEIEEDDDASFLDHDSDRPSKHTDSEYSSDSDSLDDSGHPSDAEVDSGQAYSRDDDDGSAARSSYENFNDYHSDIVMTSSRRHKLMRRNRIRVESSFDMKEPLFHDDSSDPASKGKQGKVSTLE
jgi:hypothetical protein